MIKFIFQLLAFFCTVSAFSGEKSENKILDFSKVDIAKIPGYGSFDWNEIGKHCAPFNNALDLGPYFYFLKAKHNLEIAVETGTYLGETTKFLGIIFDQVHTIELDDSVFQDGQKILSPYANIHTHHGNSSKVLKKILPSLKNRPILFYLDAHWYDWPLLDELDVISKTHKDNCIIVIDDFKVPGASISFDRWDGNSCSYEYIKKNLSKVFSSYEYYYVIPKLVSARAKFIAFPKKWGGHAQLIKSLYL